MSLVSTVLGDLPDVLCRSIEARGLPGATVAVLHGGDVVEAAGGVLNLTTQVEATTDSLFQIGSITKVYTATLVLQLVDAGLVDLDSPVRTYVPEFSVADPEATALITARHLLTHTAGFDGGDHFVDTGRGDDALHLYVEGLAELEQISPVGSRWSYNNAGFTVLGRLVEIVTGQVWDDALRDRLLVPAGLTQSVTLPEDVLLHRAAAGHFPGADGKSVLVQQWGMARSGGPAGLVCASAADVVGFARLHLEDGRGPGDAQVLSPASTKAMQKGYVDVPSEKGATMGLAWLLRDLDGERAVTHNGGTLGQAAFLLTLPDRGFAIALLTNGPTGGLVWEDVAGHVLDRMFGLPFPKPILPSAAAEPPAGLDLAKYEGTFVRRAIETTISLEEGGLVAHSKIVNVPFDLPDPPPLRLQAVDAEVFLVLGPDDQPAMTMQFFEFDDDGRPTLLFADRLSRRRDEARA